MADDFFKHFSPGRDSFGRRGNDLTPSDSTDIDPIAKAVVVTSIAGGDVIQVLPVDNLDGVWVTITGVAPGYSPPYQVRRLGLATTCSVASVFDDLQ